MKRFCLTTFAAALLSVPVLAQSMKPPSEPVFDAARQILERQSRNLVAAAEEMPPDHYDYKPTPQQRSFGEIVSHTAQSNNFLCSKISGLPPRAQYKPAVFADSKTASVDALRASFDFCKEAFLNMNDAHLSEQVEVFGGRRVSRVAALFALTSDWADHYSAMAVYLRLNKLLPPTAKQEGSGGSMKPLKP